MTIAILRENTDLIWFDAVLKFGEQYNTSVTKHRVESGASISDHIIEENSKDVFERGEYERKREAVHILLNLPYKVKGNDFMSWVRSVLNLEYTMENNLALHNYYYK